MKIALFILGLGLSAVSSAAVPPKITIVGNYKSMDKSIVSIQAEKKVVRVPKTALANPKAMIGDQVVARVPIKDFLALNKR